VDTNSYVAFLLIGTVLVLLDGQVIYRNGRKFLQQSAPSASAESLTRLVSVLVHLAVLGVLALISTIDLPADNATEGIVMRLGVILIVLGIAHWISITALTRIRDRQEFDEVHLEREARRVANEQANAAYGTAVPAPAENPAYTGDSATAAINRQQPHPRT
jgi:hypothetical protein